MSTENPNVIASICGIEHQPCKDGPWVVVGDYCCQPIPSKWIQSVAVALDKGAAPEILKFRDTYRVVVITVYDDGTNGLNDFTIDAIMDLIKGTNNNKESK